MEIIDIDQAIEQIYKLIETASTGEEVIITKNKQPIVKLISCQTPTRIVQPKREPLFGSDRGIISITDDFDEPLDDFKEYM